MIEKVCKWIRIYIYIVKILIINYFNFDYCNVNYFYIACNIDFEVIIDQGMELIKSLVKNPELTPSTRGKSL